MAHFHVLQFLKMIAKAQQREVDRKSAEGRKTVDQLRLMAEQQRRERESADERL